VAPWHDEVFLAFLNEEIYAIGPRLKNRDDARAYIGNILSELSGNPREGGRLLLLRDDAGHHALVLEGSTGRRHLARLDEFTLHRLKRSMGRRFVILTGFVESADGNLECLALTDGLGAVLYAT